MSTATSSRKYLPDEERRHQDYLAMKRFESDVLTWKAMDEQEYGPINYRIEYDLKSIIGWNGNQPIEHRGFSVNIHTDAPYPKGKAAAHFIGMTPWHPNVHPDGRICYSGIWIESVGITLDKICEIIGAMIAFQRFGHRDQDPIRREDSFWQQFEYARSKQLFPTDDRPIRRGGFVPSQPDNSQIIRFG